MGYGLLLLLIALSSAKKHYIKKKASNFSTLKGVSHDLHRFSHGLLLLQFLASK